MSTTAVRRRSAPARTNRTSGLRSTTNMCHIVGPAAQPHLRRRWEIHPKHAPDARTEPVPPRVVPLRYSRIHSRGRTLVIGAAASILLLTTACGSSSSNKSGAPTPAAATVSGTEVSAAAVLADLKAEAAAGKKGKA